MTRQIGDDLIADGEKFCVEPYPLGQLPDKWREVTADGQPLPKSPIFNTANRRGYIATWTIENGGLYLTGFTAHGAAGKTLDITDVFGVERLFADWFTGELFEIVGRRRAGEASAAQVWRFVGGLMVRHAATPQNISSRE